jgi:hypothetical protein
LAEAGRPLHRQAGSAAAGHRPAALEAEAAKRGRKWIQGIALSREIFEISTADRPSDAK